VRGELGNLFPEAKGATFAGDDKEHDKYGGRPIQFKLDFGTYKRVYQRINEGEYDLIRYLVAENS
jgi:hypothetical protein